MMIPLLVLALLVIPFGGHALVESPSGLGPVGTPASPPFSANIKLSDDPGTGNQNEVSMVMDTMGRMVAAWNDRRGVSDYRCGRSYSLNRGQAWSANVLYGNSAYDAAGDPVLAADDAGNIYHICMSFNRTAAGSTMEVMMTQDGGVTWTSPVDIGMPTGEDDKPWIAAHGNGIVFVGWSHIHSGTVQVVFRASHDWGENWSTPVYLGSFASAYLGMDVDDSGFVHTVFYQSGNMVYRRSEDLGVSFTPQVFISPAGDDCFSCNPRSGTLPALAASGDGKDLYAVWSGNFSAPTGEDIRLAYSHNGGSSWNTVTVNDDGTLGARQFMPYVDVDWEGRVHVMWSDLRSGNHEVYYSNSTDGGITFASSVPVTDVNASTVSFQGDYQVILVDSLGVAHIAWCDTRNGHGDIYYATAQVANESITIVVSPSFSQITADETLQFTATGYDGNGSQISITPTWETTGGVIGASGFYVPARTGNITVYANYSGASGSATVNVLPGALASITVDPLFTTITADETEQFSAMGHDGKGNEMTISPTWETNGGSIDASGLYTPSQMGIFSVFANETGFSGSATIIVTAGALASIVIDPPTTTISADEAALFTAGGQDAQGNDVSISPTWEATGGSVDSMGLYTPTSTGTFRVYANESGISGSATVVVVAGALASITLDPPFKTLTADETQQFTATGYDAEGNEVTMSPAWEATGGAINPSGDYTPFQVGSFIVFANQSGISGSAIVTVTPGLLASIAIAPTGVVITADDTALFTGVGYDARGNEVPISPAWEATGGSVGSKGLYSPSPVGSFVIYANESGVSGSATIEVTAGALASILLDPGTSFLTADGTQQFTAEGIDAHGNPVPLSVDWTARNGTISEMGLFSPWSTGNWTVTAQEGSVRAVAVVEVSPGAVHRLQISPAHISLQVGDEVTFIVMAWDFKGNLIESPQVTWGLQGDVGTLEQTGHLVTDRAGSGMVSASVGTVSVSAEVDVLFLDPLAPLQDYRVYLAAAGLVGLLALVLLLRRRGRRRSEK